MTGLLLLNMTRNVRRYLCFLALVIAVGYFAIAFAWGRLALQIWLSFLTAGCLIGGILLSCFKRKVDISERHHALCFKIDSPRSKDRADIEIPLETMDYYRISYPQANDCRIYFRLRSGTTYDFYLSGKQQFSNQDSVVTIAAFVQQTIQEYSAAEVTKIERRLSFFATNLGWYVIIAECLVALVMGLMVLKGAKGWVSVPVLLGFMSMAAAQRSRERSDLRNSKPAC